LARPVDNVSLSRRVYHHLRDLLISGQLQPGERLTLAEVANAVGTSHMPVREAVRQLVAERALTMLPNRALQVPVMTVERFRQLLNVRKLVEGDAVVQAAQRIDAPAVAQLRTLNQQFGAQMTSKAPDVSALIALNKALHFGIYEAAGNAVQLELIELLWLQVGPVINLDLRSGSRRLSEAPALACHQRIIDALASGDAAGARAGLEADLDSAAEVIISDGRLAKV
jgi:DNA-binding GntR family transcriptional regulator